MADILVHITDEGFHDNYNNGSDNQPNNQINAHYDLIKSRGRNVHKAKTDDNKSNEAQMQIKINESNRNIKSINRTDGSIKHFIRIYHWLGIDKPSNKKFETVVERKANK